ncbi:MAG: hypothetical protein Q9187_005978, partial [Circinaria calcarea]
MAPPNQLHRQRTKETFKNDVPKATMSDQEYRIQHEEEYGRNQRPHWRSNSPENKDCKQYKTHQKQSQMARRAYEGAREEAKEDYRGLTREKKHMEEYYEATSDGLLPLQHRELQPSAAEWEDKAYKHANGRADHLKQYPFALPDPKSFNGHRGAAIKAYDTHQTALGTTNRHQRYASDANDTRRDLYGQEVTRGYQPSPFPYPSFQPQPGEYSKHLSSNVPSGSAAEHPATDEQAGPAPVPPTLPRGFVIPRAEVP